MIWMWITGFTLQKYEHFQLVVNASQMLNAQLCGPERIFCITL